jgi:hypothetical protein
LSTRQVILAGRVFFGLIDPLSADAIGAKKSVNVASNKVER